MLIKKFCEREVDLRALCDMADQPIPPNATPAQGAQGELIALDIDDSLPSSRVTVLEKVTEQMEGIKLEERIQRRPSSSRRTSASSETGQ